MKRLLILMALCGWLAGSATAQPWAIHAYGSEEGLPSDIIKDIAKDTLGFLWMATDDGIARFDGLRFEAFRRPLPSVFAKKILPSRRGDLLVATDLGVVRIQSLPDTAVLAPLIPGSLAPTDSTVSFPKSLYEAKDGTLWMGEPREIAAFRDGRLQRYFLGEACVSSSFTTSFLFGEDAYGDLWATSYTGRIFRYDARRDRFVEMPADRPLRNITAFLPWENGQWLLGSYEGVFVCQVHLGRAEISKLLDLPWIKAVQRLPDGRLRLGTRADGVYEAGPDGQGRWQANQVEGTEGWAVNGLFHVEGQAGWWVSSQEGAKLMMPAFFAEVPLQAQRPMVHGLSASANGGLAVAEGRFAYWLPAEGGAPQLWWGYDGRYAMSVSAGPSGVWLGMSSGEVYRLLGAGRPPAVYQFGRPDPVSTHVQALLATQGMQVWASHSNVPGAYQLLSTAEGQPPAWRYFGPEEGLTTPVQAFLELPGGEVLLAAASDTAYLFRYHPATHALQPMSFPLPADCRADFRVNDLALLPDGGVVLATSCGLLLLPRGKPPRHYRQGLDPLHGLEVGSVEAVGATVWATAKQGIFCYADAAPPILFDESSGLPARPHRPRSLQADAQGRLWVGTMKGLARAAGAPHFFPSPRPLLTRLLANGQQVPSLGGAVLEASGAYLQVHYAPMSHPGEEVQYLAVLCAGPDTVWQQFTRDTQVLLPPLQPGEYQFWLRAQHLNGQGWSEAVGMRVQLDAPWHQQWWALLLYMMAAYAVIAAIVRWNTWRLVRAKQALARAVRERMAESVAQQQQLSEQKEELARQRDYIGERNARLEEAQGVIEQQNRQLTEANQLLEAQVRRRTADLNQALDALRKSHSELDYFIYRAAHDLRGPIARVGGLAMLLRQLAKAPEAQECVGHLQTTAEHMGNMLDRLLHTLDMKSTQPNWEALPLREVLQRLLGKMRGAGAVELAEASLPEGPWPYVKADAMLLERLLHNLIQNAIDFQDPYQPFRLQFEVRESGGTVCLHVIDGGRGIAPEASEKIFDLFYIGHEHATGAGLGLYEARVIAQKLQGSVRLLESRPGHTEFELCLQQG